MEKVDGGYILLARRLTGPDSWLMNKPPLYLKLWIWMLGQANWKDRDKLKRGQLVTSIDEMREAMSYQVGYRKITPTRDEIRSAYRAFCENPHEDRTNPPMITTTKTTRGMIITICNYDKYQDFKSYEAHSEPHDENPAKPTVTPHDTEYIENKNEKGITSLSPDSGATKKKRDQFKPPTVEEVAAYCKERGNGIDAQLFVDAYAAKGWVIGKSKMKDWKAAVRTWERNDSGKYVGNQGGSAIPLAVAGRRVF